MAIRDLWAFDHLPTPAGIGPLGPLGFFRSDLIYNSQTSATHNGNTASWIQFPTVVLAGPSSIMGNFGIPYAAVSDYTQRRSFIGFRFLFNNLNAGAVSSACNLVNAAGTSQILVPTSILTANVEQYIEIMIDRANKVFVVWVDGVKTNTTIFDFNAFMGTTGNLFFGTTFVIASTLSNNTWQIKNVYFVDDTQDATLCYRLGPVAPTDVTLSAVSAPNWTSSDSGTPLADLTTPMIAGGGAEIAPLQNMSATLDPIVATLSASPLDSTLAVIALKTYCTSQMVTGPAVSFQTEFDYNSATKAGNKLTYTGTSMRYNQTIGLETTAADGTPLTFANINLTQLKLTPALIA